jgi:hypothetical protein
MINNDPYDGGTPKYSTAQDIYDALCEMEQTEEMGILNEIGERANLLDAIGLDVSWENQDFVYFEKGCKLKEKFDNLTDYGNRMWLADLAIMRLDCLDENGAFFEIHDFVYEALMNNDLAKRVGFKKLFVDDMLNGQSKGYAEIAEQYADELGELNRFGFRENAGKWSGVMERQKSWGRCFEEYGTFTRHLINKLMRLELFEEMRLVCECRAVLTSYDDFIFGLRVNQSLHEEQERAFGSRLAALQSAYDAKLAQLRCVAESAGLLPALTKELEQIKPALLAEPEEQDV